MLNKLLEKTGKLSIFSIVLVTIMCSCTSNRVFTLKKDDFMGKMSRKEYQFLSDVDYLKNSIKEINRLGRGASYYMSFVYKKSGMLLFSNKLLYQEIQNKDKYFGPKAAHELLEQLIQEKDYVKAEAHALDFFDNYKGVFPDVTKKLIEAIYWQKKDEQVVSYINNLDRKLYTDYENYELDMLKSVSSARLGLPGWQEDYRNLFFNQPITSLLSRAYSFIDVYPVFGEDFTSDERNYFKALSYAGAGNYRKAQEVIRPLLYKSPWIFSTNNSIRNISRIIKESRVISANLSPFRSAIDNAPVERLHDATVYFASLYFSIENFTSVVNILEDELDLIEHGKTRDDAIWLYLLSLSHTGLDKIVSKLSYYIDKFSDENYTLDVIDYVITTLVQNKKWEELKDLKEVVVKYGSIEDVSRIKWILSRAYYYNYLISDDNENLIETFYDEIVTADSESYYSFFTNALLKRESNLKLSAVDIVEEKNSDDLWIEGFLSYGLEDEALEYSLEVEDLNFNVALNVASLLDSEGKHLEVLRFLSRMDIPLNEKSYPLYYPLPFKDKIAKVAADYKFPVTLFSGLIRTESGFDMEVVSSAGAVGLSQLMPETAIEQAKDIGMKNPDLNDPDTNILLGGAYIDWLMDRFYTYPISCMAYNAGPGNLWKWQRLWGDLPDELFLEAAPFKETRNYVPKILRSAIYYGYYEFNISPYETVRDFFKDIK